MTDNGKNDCCDKDSPATDHPLDHVLCKNKCEVRGPLRSIIERCPNFLLFRISTGERHSSKMTIHEIQADLKWSDELKRASLGDTFEIAGSITPNKRIIASKITNITRAEKGRRKGPSASIVYHSIRPKK